MTLSRAQRANLRHSRLTAAPVRLTTAGRAARRTKMLEWIGVHSLAIAAALFFVLPFVFVFLTALMSDQQALTRDLWPNSWHWENLRTVWETPGFLTWWKNTLIYAGLGDKDQAFAELQKSRDSHDGRMYQARFEPAFDNLMGDPRFAELMRSVNLTP